MPTVSRIRGTLLRLARRRRLAITVGLLLIVPAAWVEFTTQNLPWWASGLALVGGATGLAILLIGVSGATPDWVE